MDIDMSGDNEANAQSPVCVKACASKLSRVSPHQKRKSSSKRLLSTDERPPKMPSDDKSKKQKRGKQLRDQNAPRMPLNGYVRFLNANRERVKAANPTKSFADITKLLAAEWSALASDQKQKYLDEAERDKEKYLKELQEYQQTEAYQEFQIKQKQRKDQKMKEKKGQSITEGEASSGPTPSSKPMSGSSAHNINGSRLHFYPYPTSFLCSKAGNGNDQNFQGAVFSSRGYIPPEKTGSSAFSAI